MSKPAHSVECVNENARRLEARESWLHAWPNHCRNCFGHGGTMFYETHGLPGPGEPMWEDCICRAEYGKCPRCGAATFGEDCDNYDDCRICTWGDLAGNFDCAPGPLECLGYCLIPDEEVPF